jgi:hypothetical protein
LLTSVVAEQTRNLDRFAVNAADTYDRLGDIALTRLRYAEAAKHFASAARRISARERSRGQEDWLPVRAEIASSISTAFI